MSDGDALLQTALLTCSRGPKPRDNGLAIGVLADWIAEKLETGRHVALVDSQISGIALVVIHLSGDDFPYRCTLFAEDADGDMAYEMNVFSDLGAGGSGGGDGDFHAWFKTGAAKIWGMGRP